MVTVERAPGRVRPVDRLDLAGGGAVDGAAVAHERGHRADQVAQQVDGVAGRGGLGERVGLGQPVQPVEGPVEDAG